MDWLYLIPTAVLVAMEAEAFFNKRSPWNTITDNVQGWEKHSRWIRLLVLFVMLVTTAHLVVNVPGFGPPVL